MKNFLRTLKSEFRRIFSDRKLVLCTLAVLVGFIVVLSIFLSAGIVGGYVRTTGPSMEDCQRGFEYYRNHWLYYNGEVKIEDLPPFSISTNITPEYAKEHMEYYAFMLRNGGEEYRFIDLLKYHDQPGFYGPPQAFHGANAMLWIMGNIFYVLLFAAILISSLICIAPYKSGVMKNYYASPISKRTLFAGKLTACWIMCALCWLVVFVWGLIFGTVGESVRVLHYNGSEYISYGMYGVYVTKMFGVLIAMLVVSSLTAFIGKLSGKNFPSAAGVILGCTFFAILFEIKGAAGFTTPLKMTLLPVIGLRACPYIAADGGLWGLYVFYVILSAALFAASVYISGKTRKTY